MTNPKLSSTWQEGSVGVSQFESDFVGAVSVLGQRNTTLVVDQDISIVESVDIPNNISIRVTPGKVISLVGEVTISFYGSFFAAPKACFSFTESAGYVVFNRGCGVTTIYPNWWGFSTEASSSDNARFFNWALDAAITAGVDIEVPPGIYACDQLMYIKTSDSWMSGIEIRGQRSSYGHPISYATITAFDFSGFSDASSSVGLLFENMGLGTIDGLTIRDLFFWGPNTNLDSPTNVTKGISIHGDSGDYQGIMNLRLVNVRVSGFSTGVDVAGEDSWPLFFSQCDFSNNYVGLRVVNSTSGLYEVTNFTGNVVGVLLDSSAKGQTFINPIFQNSADVEAYGVIVDTTVSGVDSSALLFNNPYFENIQGACFAVGYKVDQTKAIVKSNPDSEDADVWGYVVNGGTYDVSDTTPFLLSNIPSANFSGNSFNSVCKPGWSMETMFSGTRPSYSDVLPYKDIGGRQFFDSGGDYHPVSSSWIKGDATPDRVIRMSTLTIEEGAIEGVTFSLVSSWNGLTQVNSNVTKGSTAGWFFYAAPGTWLSVSPDGYEILSVSGQVKYNTSGTVVLPKIDVTSGDFTLELKLADVGTSQDMSSLVSGSGQIILDLTLITDK